MSDIESLKERRYLSDRFRFAAPGDRQEPYWILKFDDADRRDLHFKTEVEAWAAWNQFAPTYNCRLFETALLSPDAALTTLQSKLAEAERALEVARRNIRKLPPGCLGHAYADDAYIPRMGSGRVDAIIDAKTVSVRDELLAMIDTTLATIREEEQ